jgi:hypothetical protein
LKVPGVHDQVLVVATVEEDVVLVQQETAEEYG